MNYKKLFVLCALSAFAAVGCSDDKKDDKKEDKTTTDVCANYENSCDGQVWKTCANGKENTVTCQATETCDPQKGCQPAQSGDICKDYVSTCNDNVWKTCADNAEKVVVCKPDQTCDANKGCVDNENKDKCDASTFQPKCDTRNNVWLKGCNGDDYIRVNCSNTQTCDNEKGCITTSCTNSTPISCDGSIATECVDGVLKNTNCAYSMQICVPEQGCVVPEESKCDPATSVAKCSDNNVLVYCDANESVQRTMSCPDGTFCDSDKHGCRKATQEGESCKINETKCEGNMLWMCLDDGKGNGVWLGDECSSRGKSCIQDASGAACKDTYSAVCDNNTLTICDGNSCIDENCTLNGKICDEEAQDCVDAAGFTCNDSTITVEAKTGDFYAYDCASNGDGKVGCNTAYGCSDEFCTDTTYNVCGVSSTGIECLTENCAESGSTCSDAYKDCISCDSATFKATCSGDTATYCDRGKIVTQDCTDNSLEDGAWSCVEGEGCVAANPCEVEDEISCILDDPKHYNVCIGGALYVESCDKTSTCSSEVSQSVFDSTQLCGNGVLETGEKCDPGDADNAPSAIYKSCSDLWPDSFKTGAYIGAPSCKSDCSGFDSSSCTPAEDFAHSTRYWKITDTTSLAELAKANLISIAGGFTTTTATDGKWTIGPWGNASNPAFDNRYISLVPNDTDTLDPSAYAVLGLRFTVSRNAKGPKKLKVRFYNGSDAIDTSDAIDITTTDTMRWAFVKVPSKYTDTLSIRISAYDSETANGGNMTLSDISLVGVLK